MNEKGDDDKNAFLWLRKYQEMEQKTKFLKKDGNIVIWHFCFERIPKILKVLDYLNFNIQEQGFFSGKNCNSNIWYIKLIL